MGGSAANTTVRRESELSADCACDRCRIDSRVHLDQVILLSNFGELEEIAREANNTKDSGSARQLNDPRTSPFWNDGSPPCR
jgi:hypothetical protein